MTPVLFTAAVVLMAPSLAPSQHPLDPPAPAPVLKNLPLLAPGQTIRSFVLKDLPMRDCSEFAIKTAGPDGTTLKKLGDLPPGLPEHAVLRTIHGCPVREIMYAGGGTYYLGVPQPAVEGVSPVVKEVLPSAGQH
jgi:hypothetical protein